VEQDSGNINKTQSKATPNESSSQGTNSGGGPWCQETMGDTTVFESVSKHSNDSLLARGNTLQSDEDSLKLNELMALCKDTPKHGRIDAIDADEEITLVSAHDVNVSAGEEVLVAEQEDVVEEVVEVINTAKLIIDDAQVSAAGDIVSAATLEEIKSTKPKMKGVVIQELGEYTTTISSQLSSQQSQEKDEFDKEERLVREKAKKVEEANINLIETWDDIQAKIDVDHQLVERMQAQEQEELSIKEKATLFQQLLEKRRKHFAAKRAKEKRNKPPTKAQQRKIMCTYLKNMEGYKLKDLKLKEFDYIQEMFDRAFKRVNIFEDFRTELVEGKPPNIVDWKIYKEGRKSYYQIMRADGKSQMYIAFSQMLKSFDKEDLEDLYKLVKAKYESKRLVEDLDLLLWGDLKTMFEPHIYMLVEKKYPLTPPTLLMMLEKKLIIEYESEMAYQLVKFIMKQLKK
ncbi:hypothetical protein Tco_0996229, partial [Tanacetum coccineum]